MKTNSMLTQKVLLADEAATIAFGKKISTYLQPKMILDLRGELGAGKTTLTRGIVQGLGGNAADVTSPTFNLVHEYLTPVSKIIHCDFYRLPEHSTIDELGGMEFFHDDAVYITEWLQRLGYSINIYKNQIVIIEMQIHNGKRLCSFPSAWKVN